MSNIEFQEKDGSITFTVRVIPRASKSEVVGEHNGTLKIKLKSPPVDGAANDELINLLAELIGVRRHSIEILSGHSSRTKRIRVIGVSRERLRRIISK